ncbi:MAG: hypothetical protein LBQ19_03830, partial [Synergistaceae bacterium]|nr:hypothetical protein [Synergistaceae bacterium]
MSESMFQVAGVASGIAWDEIITKTLEAASKPAQIWQSKIDTLEYKKSMYQELSAAFYKLRNTLTSLRYASTYKAKTAEFAVRNPGDTFTFNGTTSTKSMDAASIIKATVNADADISQWKIDVQQVARAQQQYSKRFDDATAKLGLSGTFKIRQGSQVAEIEIKTDDTLNTINQKIATAKDQSGKRLAGVTAKLIDNRLVIESTLTGLINTGKKESEVVAADGSDTMLLPRAGVVATYPPQLATYPPELLSVNVEGTNYIKGTDFTYTDVYAASPPPPREAGTITWISQIPDKGDEVTLGYGCAVTVNRTTGQMTDTAIDGLPSGVDYDLTNMDFEIIDKNGKKYTYGATADFTIDVSDPVNPTIQWNDPLNVPPDNENYSLIVTQTANNYSTDQNTFYLEFSDAAGEGLLTQLGLYDATITDDTTTPYDERFLNVSLAQDAIL